jgi:hypothetical protein
MAETFYLVFEPVNETTFRIIILEKNEYGNKSVYDIIEMNTSHPVAPYVRLVLRFLGHSSSDVTVQYQSRWPAALNRLRSHEARVRRLIKSYPGIDSCEKLQKIATINPPKVQFSPFV